MSNGENPANRRKVLQLIGASGALAASPVAAARSRSRDRDGEESRPDELRLNELAIEAALHTDQSVAALTTIGIGDGYQLYLARDVQSLSDTVHVERDLEQLSRAEAGVHGVHWTSESTLKYSIDGKTVERSLTIADDELSVQSSSGQVTVVDDRPLPVRSSGEVSTQAVDIPYPIDCKSGGNVCCTDLPFVSDWCIRVTGNDSGHSPECNGHNPPAMHHGHLAIFPEGNYRSGINIWAGNSGNCVWVGEEHSTKWCTRVCGPEGGLPSLTDLRDAFEDALNKAADAAGIAVPAIVITALAYYLAASTLAPPTGVPLI